MRLKYIKLAGFKSFVDPTHIPVSSSLIGVVGPNGCGKSNIIDAVRWVMGESSAKNLRGDSMADVIFSGSKSRKPVGKASVELMFDTSDGRAPGQYAAYAEISIKREATRDGHSDYFINKTKCRRKDITDLFLGTGLGPRTYSIIEQGMVTRIIEAKPEDLRGFLEEAAGISKYKERRRETETRIRHTRENLDRVQDIRGELETQINKLQRQSKAAAKYKGFKKEDRLLNAQLLTLRHMGLNKNLKQQDVELSRLDIDLQAVIAKQRESEAGIEDLRNRQTEANDHFNKVQAEFYAAGAEISGVEQNIQHARESRQQREREQEQVNRSWKEASEHLESDQALLEELEGQIAVNAPEEQVLARSHEETAEVLKEAEAALHEWQAEWQRFSEVAAEPDKIMEIQKARMEQTSALIRQLNERMERMATEQKSVSQQLEQEDISLLKERAQKLEQDTRQRQEDLEECERDIQDLRRRVDDQSELLKDIRGEFQTADARLTTLKELQDAAEGKHDASLTAWLASHGIQNAKRLSQIIKVESGWETACERVLGQRLNAVCVDKINHLTQEMVNLKDSNLLLLETSGQQSALSSNRPTLLDKLEPSAGLEPWLCSILVANDLTEAISLRETLAAHESVLTRDGIWLGKNWISVERGETTLGGTLRRAQEIGNLESKHNTLGVEIDRAEETLESLREEIRGEEAGRDEKRRELNSISQERAEALELLGGKEARYKEISLRKEQIVHERLETEAQLQENQDRLSEARSLLSEAENLSGSHVERRESLEQSRDSLSTRVDQVRSQVTEARDQWHEAQIESQRLQTTRDSTRQSISRLENQLAQLKIRRQELDEMLSTNETPETDYKSELEVLLEKRVAVEQRLAEARKTLTELDERLHELEEQRVLEENKAQEVRQEMEDKRIKRQEVSVRQDTLVEQLVETNYSLEQVMQELPEEAIESDWQELSEKMQRRITRLGPINLVAIEEYEEQSERKSYLDKQYEDLNQALSTLEEVMHKIDRETRNRFKETFDKVNDGLQAYFPKLFGGGHAYLELTGEDLLDTGVSVMARPPGKRNSTIHLLSGGEKALTAVALIFSIFQLNPAPFCLLDEVDAPLDDANVERYSETIKEMAEETQLLFVTHNKITMEAAELLLGVTMSEPGVSRLVAVDVEEAMEMVV